MDQVARASKRTRDYFKMLYPVISRVLSEFQMVPKLPWSSYVGDQELANPCEPPILQVETFESNSITQVGSSHLAQAGLRRHAVAITLQDSALQKRLGIQGFRGHEPALSRSRSLSVPQATCFA